MIIVSGFLRVDPDRRAGYLDSCDEVIRAARTAPGCLDFHVSADPIEADRINIFEQWETAESVATFRGSGPGGEQQADVIAASVMQHEIARSTSLT